MDIIGKINSWLKLAQEVEAPAEGDSTEPTTPINISGNPSSFQVLNYYPSVNQAWGSQNLSYIQEITNDLNQALYVVSMMQLDLNKLRNAAFNVDPSKYPTGVLISIVKLSQLIYNRILTNSGQPFKTPLNAEDKKARLLQVMNFINSSNIPSGTTNQFLQIRIGGNFREKILSLLQNIK